jgi:hypothetical protein
MPALLGEVMLLSTYDADKILRQYHLSSISGTISGSSCFPGRSKDCGRSKCELESIVWEYASLQ